MEDRQSRSKMETETSFHYCCSECGKQYPIVPDRYVCESCSEKQEPDRPLRGILEVAPAAGPHCPLDLLEYLPVPRQFFPPCPVGDTPMWQPDRLRADQNLPHLFIKDDGLNPTGSLKDRASFLVAAFARQQGISDIVVASTGNAASSMAGVGASSGLDVTIFIPKTAPEAKMVQSLQYGATVHLVDGTYDDAYECSMQYAAGTGAINRNTAYNPMTIEGKKTAALEIWRDLEGLPDVLYVSMGDGCIIGGLYKGFRDLKDLGLTDRIPTIVGVQAEGSSAIARALQTGHFSDPVPSRTIADSISVDVPRNGLHALKNLQNHGGRCVVVTDEMILNAQSCLSESTGLFAEPAAAAAFAGMLTDRSNLSRNDRVVVLTTGTGLKDIPAARKYLDIPTSAIRSVEDLL